MNEIQQTLHALNEFAKAKKQKGLQRRDAILEEQRFLRRRAQRGGQRPP